MASKTVDMGSGIVLEMFTPRKASVPYWRFTLTQNGVQYPDLRLIDHRRKQWSDDAVDIFEVIDEWLYYHIYTAAMVATHSPTVDEALTELVREYRLSQAGRTAATTQ